MLTKRLFRSLSLTWIFGFINAAEVKRCLTAQPVENFDINAYTGRWAIYARAYKKELGELACLRFIYYDHEADDTLPMVRLWTDKSNHEMKNALLKDATLNSTGLGISLFGYSFTVIGADYKNWAAVLACDVETDERLVWISTRTTKPTHSNLQQINETLSNYNMTIEDLIIIDQTDCPVDWSDAKTDEVDFKYDDVKNDLKDIEL